MSARAVLAAQDATVAEAGRAVAEAEDVAAGFAAIAEEHAEIVVFSSCGGPAGVLCRYLRRAL